MASQNLIIMIKKLFTLFTLILLAIPLAWGDDQTITMSAQGWDNQEEVTSVTVGVVTITCAKNNGSYSPAYYNTGTGLRLYAGNTMTISVDETKTMTSIVLSFSGSGYMANFSVSSGSYNTNNNSASGTWTGKSPSVVFTNTNGTCRLQKVTVFYEDASSTNYELSLPTGLTGGSVTAEGDGVSDLTSIPSGTSLTVTATPNPGYVLEWMKANSTVVSSPYTFNINENTVITANFIEPNYPDNGTMTFVQTSSSAGTLTDAPTGVTATFSNTYTGNKEQLTAGNTMTLTIKGMPLTYRITGVTLNVRNNSTAGDGTATVTMNGTTIGSLEIKGLGNTYTEKDVTIEQCPFSGNLVITISASESSVYCNAFYIDYEKIVEKTYDVTVTQSTGGTITARPEGEKVVDEGDKIIVTATPDPGYELSSWTITGASETEPDESNQITATGNVTITATFSKTKNKVEYTITPQNSGEVWLEEGAPYSQELGYSTSELGTTVKIKLVPGSGYDINTLTITDANGATVQYEPLTSDWSGNKYGTHYQFTMPATAVTIAATFKQGDIYILGTANDNAWAGNVGVPMTYNATENTYTARVYFKGDSNSGDEVLGYGRFSFADRLGNADWSNMGKRFGANDGNNYDLSEHEWSGGWTDNNQSNPNAFMLPAGVYTVTVNWGTGIVSATKDVITVSLDKAAGQLETGTTVNVSSNLTPLLSAIKSGVSATLAYSTDNGTNYTDGSSFVVNNALTAKGKAYYGKIEQESASYAYTTITITYYTITTSTDSHGTVEAQVDGTTVSRAEAGETVTLVYSPQSDFQLATVTVTDADNNAVTVTDNTFVMPASNVNVSVTFTKIPHNITVSGECVKCTITGYPETATSGSTVSFTVTPASSKYSITSVTATNTNGNTNQLDLTGPTDNGDGSYTYSFTMQAYDVVLKAVCEKAATGNTFVLVTKQSDIVDGGKYVILSNGKNYIATNWNSGKYFNYGSGTDCFELNGDGDVVTTKSEDVNVFTLEATGSGTFYLKASDGKYYSVASDVTNNKSGQYITVNTDENYLYRVTISSNGSAALNETSNYKLGFNEQSPRFKGYKTLKTSFTNDNYQSPIYLYKQQTTTVEDTETLAWIEEFGDEGETFTVADDLQVVCVATEKKADNTSTEYAFARDFAFNDDGEEINTSIAPVFCPEDAVDFMRKVSVGDENDHQDGEWKQNNWVRLDISDIESQFTGFSPVTAEHPVHVIIKGGTLKGKYVDKDNYTIKVSSDATLQFENPTKNYTPNVYSPANFYIVNGTPTYIQTIQTGVDEENDNSPIYTDYWFMTPKVMEVCKFTWAMYYDKDGYDAGFYMQDGETPLKGGVGIDMSYNTGIGDDDLVSGESYRFTSVIMKAVTGKKDDPDPTNPDNHYPQEGSTLNTKFKVAATNLDPENNEGQIVTGVSEVKTGGEVVSVTYCDLAGRMSQKPFAGVNIIVTRYSDGTVKTTKAIK